MLRDGYEDARGKSHVEDSVALFAIVLDLHDVLVELLEWFILVILSSKIRASLAESLKLFFNLLGRGLDVGPDPLEVFFVVHFRSGISDNLDVFWKEFVAVLQRSLAWINDTGKVGAAPGRKVLGRSSFWPDHLKLQEQ